MRLQDIAVVIVAAALLLFALTVQAQDMLPLVVRTDHYQLDTGQHVYTWLDEPRGLLCVMVIDAGLSCLPLTASSYNWPIVNP